LIEDHEHSHQASEGLLDNRLLHGDNLPALKLLEHELRGKVKCVLIDPPYNTGRIFDHYGDRTGRSHWLSMMQERLEKVRELLSEDGSLWIIIGDAEMHYLKVLCDRILGRDGYRNTVAWRKCYAQSNNCREMASVTDFLLVYAKSKEYRIQLLPRTEESRERYSNPDGDPRGPWHSNPYANVVSPQKRPKLCYDIVNPNTGSIAKNINKAWKYEPAVHERHLAERRLWWGVNGTNRVPRLKLFLSEVREGVMPSTWWPCDEVGHTDEARKEVLSIFGLHNPFETPKPERLIHRVLTLATKPGDLVLDCFAGSGTTGAVAHKMGRRWIMIEQGDHCLTHIVPRLKAVVDGTDQGGVSKVVGWQGGGGFRYFKLGSSTLESVPRVKAQQSPLMASSYDGGLDLDEYLEAHPDLFTEETERPRRGRRSHG
jgi:adenine-specific DNA-methyltransferase